MAIAFTLSVIGLILLWLPGALTGVAGFLFINAGLPVLSLTGVPALSNSSRFLIAIIASVGLWWIIGYFAAVRASRRAITDWAEWRREYQPLAIGVWAGTILAFGVAAFVLGAF